jgi:signal transduction histidine kinase
VGIHDDTLQAMTAASLRVQQLRRRLDDHTDLDVVDKLEETIQLSISRLRRLMFDLRPPASDQGGLAEALKAYLERLFNHGELVYTVRDERTTELSQETQVIAYRIAQEAQTNVWLHADANSVNVRLSDVDDGCLMVVEDDGMGYDPVDAEGKRDHLGLTLMQERAHIAGGWCRIESAPGEGTMVQFWLPHSPDGGRPEHSHPIPSGGD